MSTEIRGRIRETLLDLHRLEDELAELAEGLRRRNSWLSSYYVNLHAAIEAVRSDCIHDAIHTLQHAVRQSEESIRREWAELDGVDERDKGGISFLQEKKRHNAKRKDTPPC